LKNYKKAVLVSVFAVFIVFPFLATDMAFAQGFMQYPLDDGGWFRIKQNAFRFVIYGITLGDEVPSWQSLIQIDKPECAIVKLVDEGLWVCGNPIWIVGVSMSFGYHFQVYFPPGCKGEVCISIKGHPEYGEICIEDSEILLDIDLLNQCKNSVVDNRFIDIEKELIFSATVGSKDENFSFPDALSGEAYSNGGSEPIFMIRSGNIEYISEYYSLTYHSAEPFTPREIIDERQFGKLYFEVLFGRSAHTHVFVQEVDRFKVDEILFEDDIPIPDNPNGVFEACFPFNSYIMFGVRIENLKHSWPPDDCQEWVGTLNGYIDDQLQYSSNGAIAQDEFIIEPEVSFYQLPDGTPGSAEDLWFEWKLKVNGGPERDIMTNDTHIRIYNGFRANEIVFNNLPDDNTIRCGEELYVNANPYPNLQESPQIRYYWYWEYVSPEGDGRASFSPASSQQKNSEFIAREPGDYNLYYRITESYSGDDAISPMSLVHVEPKLEIIAPLIYSQHTYSAGNPGELTIDFIGQATPSSLNDQIEWSMQAIGSSNLITPPESRIGPDVTFMYQNLPPWNDDFGKKWIIASLPEYNVADTVNILIFYDKYANNHTGLLPNAPNWYYYWKQTPATHGVSRYGGDCTGGNGYYLFGESWFHICPHAAESDQVPCSGQTVDGIDLFAVTCRHEEQHRLDYWNLWQYPHGGYIPGLDLDPDPPPGDPLGDWLPDADEPGLGFDPMKWDTDGDNYKDFEDRGFDRECDWTPGDADDYDWANPGHQY